jgi:hypothetical protein
MIKRMNNNNTKNSTMKDAVSHMTEAIPATFSNTNLIPVIANQIQNQFIFSNQHIHVVMII